MVDFLAGVACFCGCWSIKSQLSSSFFICFFADCFVWVGCFCGCWSIKSQLSSSFFTCFFADCFVWVGCFCGCWSKKSQLSSSFLGNCLVDFLAGVACFCNCWSKKSQLSSSFLGTVFVGCFAKVGFFIESLISSLSFEAFLWLSLSDALIWTGCFGRFSVLTGLESSLISLFSRRAVPGRLAKLLLLLWLTLCFVFFGIRIEDWWAESLFETSFFFAFDGSISVNSFSSFCFDGSISVNSFSSFGFDGSISVNSFSSFGFDGSISVNSFSSFGFDGSISVNSFSSFGFDGSISENSLFSFDFVDSASENSLFSFGSDNSASENSLFSFGLGDSISNFSLDLIGEMFENSLSLVFGGSISELSSFATALGEPVSLSLDIWVDLFWSCSFSFSFSWIGITSGIVIAFWPKFSDWFVSDIWDDNGILGKSIGGTETCLAEISERSWGGVILSPFSEFSISSCSARDSNPDFFFVNNEYIYRSKLKWEMNKNKIQIRVIKNKISKNEYVRLRIYLSILSSEKYRAKKFKENWELEFDVIYFIIQKLFSICLLWFVK